MNPNLTQTKAVPEATSVLLTFLNDVGDNTDFSNHFLFPDMEMVRPFFDYLHLFPSVVVHLLTTHIILCRMILMTVAQPS